MSGYDQMPPADAAGQSPQGQPYGQPAYAQPGAVPFTDPDAALRKRAKQRLEERRGLQAHILAYVLVNGFLSVIWFLGRSDGDAFFWPIFPILGWGIGLAFHIWSYVSPEPSEADIQAEMERLRRR